MYLLNPSQEERVIKGKKFTFHYVSIKSISSNILFLLSSVFTFHYVSIKSRAENVGNKPLFEFTFHYVSIKSRKTTGRAACWIIYIPLCIY